MSEKQEMSVTLSDDVSVTDSDVEEHDDKEKRGQWSSQFEYLLTVVGYCVALGNVWRFPYICNRNGGGAFLIPFIICLVLCGLPLFFLEVALGQFSGKSPKHVWSMCPIFKGIGIGMLIVSGGTVVYYTVICAWSLYYTIYSCRSVLPWTSCDNWWNTDSCVADVKTLRNRATGFNSSLFNVTGMASYNPVNRSSMLYDNTTSLARGWNDTTLSHTAAEEFWQYNALSVTGGIHELGKLKWELALCLFGSWVLIFGCIIKGVRSVGKAVYVTATLPYVILLVLLVRGLTLPGGPSGALFYITPDFSKLLTVQVWLEACLQVFYSLGPAWGGLITMASYNKFNTNCLSLRESQNTGENRLNIHAADLVAVFNWQYIILFDVVYFGNAIICTFVSEGTSIFAGLVVFSILGFMAHEAGVPVTEVVSSGPGLGFVIYPEALAQLPLPQLWSFIFFVMLILLALDSLFSMVETCLSAILDQYPFLLKWRIHVTVVYCLVSYLLGLILCTEGGIYIFQLLDWYFVAVFLIFAGFLECIILAWIYGIGRFSDDIEMMLGRQPPLFFKITWCYVTPVMLLVTFISTLVQYKPPTYGKYEYPKYASIIGWCVAVIPLIPLITGIMSTLARGKGSLLDRVKQGCLPDSDWCPAKKSYRELYEGKRDRRVGLKETFLSSWSQKV